MRKFRLARGSNLVLLDASSSRIDPIWITDDLLTSTFHKLVVTLSRPRRRHGSATPGPLEAQKRLAKRRMMGLTTNASGLGMATQPPLGGLAGEEARKRWTWDPPSKSAKISENLPWPNTPPAIREPLPVHSLEEQPTNPETSSSDILSALTGDQGSHHVSQRQQISVLRNNDEDPTLIKAIDTFLDDPCGAGPILPYLKSAKTHDRARFVLENVFRRQLERTFEHSSASSRLNKVASKYDELIRRSETFNPGVAFSQLIVAILQLRQDHLPTLKLTLSLFNEAYPFMVYEHLIYDLLRSIPKNVTQPLLPQSVLYDEIIKFGQKCPVKAFQLLIYQNSLCDSQGRLKRSTESQLMTLLINSSRANRLPEILRLLGSRPDAFTREPAQHQGPAKLSVNPRHVDLVHDLALAMAHAPNLSNRQAYRGVMSCYGYLHSRGGPSILRPEISRALAHAGLSRDMQQSIRISSFKASFVIGWVRKLEGEEVARDLFEAYRAWVGNGPKRIPPGAQG